MTSAAVSIDLATSVQQLDEMFARWFIEHQKGGRWHLRGQLRTHPSVKPDVTFTGSIDGAIAALLKKGEMITYSIEHAADVMPFGKHAGKPIDDVARRFPDYCCWLLATVTTLPDRYPDVHARLLQLGFTVETIDDTTTTTTTTQS